MPEHRKVRRRGGQVLVPVPAPIWRRLGLTPGQEVWWHRSRKDEAILSVAERRVGARPPSDAACSHCEKREAELVRLRALLATRAAVDGRVYFNQGYEAGVSHSLKGYPALDAINDRLRDIEAQLGIRRGPWTYRAKRAAPRRAARAVEVVDASLLATGEAREQIDAAAARLGAGIGFALPAGVVAVDIPEPE